MGIQTYIGRLYGHTKPKGLGSKKSSSEVTQTMSANNYFAEEHSMEEITSAAMILVEALAEDRDNFVKAVFDGKISVTKAKLSGALGRILAGKIQKVNGEWIVEAPKEGKTPEWIGKGSYMERAQSGTEDWEAQIKKFIYFMSKNRKIPVYPDNPKCTMPGLAENIEKLPDTKKRTIMLVIHKYSNLNKGTKAHEAAHASLDRLDVPEEVYHSAEWKNAKQD